MARYEVIESKVWQNSYSGRQVSIYGALPWVSDVDKHEWVIVTRGWTIRDNRENTIGLCRAPWKDKTECEKHCAKLNSEYDARFTEFRTYVLGETPRKPRKSRKSAYAQAAEACGLTRVVVNGKTFYE